MQTQIPALPVEKLRGPNLRKLARETIRLHHLPRAGGLVAIKRGTPLATSDNTHALADALGRQGYGGLIIGVVEDFDDLTILDEEQMRAHGWVRLPVEVADAHATITE